MKPLRPLTPERDKNGYWSHPDLPEFAEDVTINQLEIWARAQGFAFDYTFMECDLEEDHPAYKSYLEGSADISSWEPSKPNESSFLISIHDTEMTPIVMWLTPL